MSYYHGNLRSQKVKELHQTLNLTTNQALLNQLMEAGYAFAIWMMPGKESINMVIALEEVCQSENFQLSSTPTGFLINAYDENHPVKPYHIQGDIILKDQEIRLDPHLTSSQIDTFKSKLLDAPDTTTVASQPHPESGPSTFKELVTDAIKEIKKGTFEKVVLSRYKEIHLPEGFSLWSYFSRLCETYPNAFKSLTFIPGKGVWIGATPELIISDNSKLFKTVSLAGTKRLQKDQPLSQIAWTQKEIEEQALVSRYIINCFKKIRLREFEEHGPKTIKAGSLAHLRTEYEVSYEGLAFDSLADQMLELLHPTSAVCGMPIESSKPWIQEKEHYDREFYSGFLGPVNVDGATDLFVNLRCMKIANGLMRLYAGAGITEDSDPQREFEETEMKMDILLSTIRS